MREFPVLRRFKTRWSLVPKKLKLIMSLPFSGGWESNIYSANAPHPLISLRTMIENPNLFIAAAVLAATATLIYNSMTGNVGPLYDRGPLVAYVITLRSKLPKSDTVGTRRLQVKR
jgi:hypothetical protein